MSVIAPPEGWPLVLEFVKALAAPTAAVVGVVLAALLAGRTFRYQKLLERRIKWHEDVVAALTELLQPIPLSEEAIRSLVPLVGSAALYADKSGVKSVQLWVMHTNDMLERSAWLKDRATLESFLRECFKVREVLVGSMRKDLRLKRIRASPAEMYLVQITVMNAQVGLEAYRPERVEFFSMSTPGPYQHKEAPEE